MSASQSENPPRFRIVRGPFDSLSLYEITDYELEIFEAGSPSSTFLNFAIFCFSLGVSFAITLLTVEIVSIYVFSVFTILTFAGLISAAVLFVLWRQTRSKTKDLCKKIRSRVPEAMTSEPKDSPAPEGPTESSG